MRRVPLVLVLLLAASAATVPASSARTGSPAAAAAPAAPAADELARADFDDDGFADLAVGVPGEDVEAHDGAGAVVVLYGSAAGLTGARAQLFHQDLPEIADRAEAGDAFGAALASGDFDNDGFADLAVGIPGEDQGQVVDAGAVHLLFGQAGGLTAAGSRGVFTETRPGDRFGAALAAGLFDGDGFVDLAIGLPGADVGAATDAGAVVMVASAGDEDHRFVQGAGVGGMAERGDRFGSALAAADLNGDGRTDLAAGAPGEDVGAAADAGSVVYLPGSAGGLPTGGGRLFAQGLGGLGGLAERGDRFGAALEAGQANTAAPADLVVGAPGEAVGQAAGSGAVSVLYGAAGGPSTAGDQLFVQGAGGIEDDPLAGDAFGAALALGQLDEDGFPDLAVGAPGDDAAPANQDTGDAVLIRGTAGGLSGAGSLSITHDVGGPNSVEAGDRFGAALAARDFDNDGLGDLAAGIPLEDVDKFRDAGALIYFQGPLGGPGGAEDRPLHQDSAGVPGAAEPGDRFGAPLAATTP
jgi:FG-GAP repeat